MYSVVCGGADYRTITAFVQERLLKVLSGFRSMYCGFHNSNCRCPRNYNKSSKVQKLFHPTVFFPIVVTPFLFYCKKISWRCLCRFTLKTRLKRFVRTYACMHAYVCYWFSSTGICNYILEPASFCTKKTLLPNK